MNYPNKLHVEQVREATKQQIEERITKNEVLQGIYEVLKRFDGKKITKRFETSVSIYFNNMYAVSLLDGRSLHVWGDNIPYNARLQLSIYVGYVTDDLFNYETFLKNSNKELYTTSVEESMKALHNVEQIVKEYNAALDALDAAKDKLRGLNY